MVVDDKKRLLKVKKFESMKVHRKNMINELINQPGLSHVSDTPLN